MSIDGVGVPPSVADEYFCALAETASRPPPGSTEIGELKATVIVPPVGVMVRKPLPSTPTATVNPLTPAAWSALAIAFCRAVATLPADWTAPRVSVPDAFVVPTVTVNVTSHGGMPEVAENGVPTAV